MLSCTACGLPRSDSPDRCAYCSIGPDGSGTYSLEGISGRFGWLAGGVTLAEARPKGDIWHIYRAGATEPELYLLSSFLGESVGVSLLDNHLEACAQLSFQRPQSPKQPIFCNVISAWTTTRLALKLDGPTGVHMIDSSGNVLLLASPKDKGFLFGLDVSIVKPELGFVPFGYFGIMLSVILAQSAFAGLDASDQAEAPQRG